MVRRPSSVGAGGRCRSAGSSGRPSDRDCPRIRIKGGAHGAMGVMEPGTDRSGGESKEVGDLRGLVAHVVTEHEDRALVGGEPTEPAVELVAIGQGQEIVGGGRGGARARGGGGGALRP